MPLTWKMLKKKPNLQGPLPHMRTFVHMYSNRNGHLSSTRTVRVTRRVKTKSGWKQIEEPAEAGLSKPSLASNKFLVLLADLQHLAQRRLQAVQRLGYLGIHVHEASRADAVLAALDLRIIDVGDGALHSTYAVDDVCGDAVPLSRSNCLPPNKSLGS